MRTKKKTWGERQAELRALAREYVAEWIEDKPVRTATYKEAPPIGRAHQLLAARDRRRFFDAKRRA